MIETFRRSDGFAIHCSAVSSMLVVIVVPTLPYIIPFKSPVSHRALREVPVLALCGQSMVNGAGSSSHCPPRISCKVLSVVKIGRILSEYYRGSRSQEDTYCFERRRKEDDSKEIKNRGCDSACQCWTLLEEIEISDDRESGVTCTKMMARASVIRTTRTGASAFLQELQESLR